MKLKRKNNQKTKTITKTKKIMKTKTKLKLKSILKTKTKYKSKRKSHWSVQTHTKKTHTHKHGPDLRLIGSLQTVNDISTSCLLAKCWILLIAIPKMYCSLLLKFRVMRPRARTRCRGKTFWDEALRKEQILREEELQRDKIAAIREQKLREEKLRAVENLRAENLKREEIAVQREKMNADRSEFWRK